MVTPAAVFRQRSLEIAAGAPPTRTTGLVLQGGGMRGVYSAAVVAELAELGLGSAFDHVLGSSAGAIHGAYYASSQHGTPLAAYLEDLSGARFISFRRLRNILDLDFLIETVMTERKPLDLQALRRSAATVHIFLTDCASGAACVVTNRDPEVDLMQALRGSAAIPVLYNRPVLVGGRRVVDGGIAAYLPLAGAIEAGCTDTLVVLTRSMEYRRFRPGAVESFVLRRFAAEIPAISALLQPDDTFNETMDRLQRGALSDQVTVTVVAPSDPLRMVARLTRDAGRLREAAEMAREDLRAALEGPP